MTQIIGEFEERLANAGLELMNRRLQLYVDGDLFKVVIEFIK